MSKKHDWPGNVTQVCEIGSQSGPVGGPNAFQNELNAYLACGWRILNTYIEDKSDKHREECKVLLGWTGDEEPRYPVGYDSE